MSRSAIHRFLRDEQGSYTVWSLVWFVLYLGLGGLAVDISDAYRNQSLLQSTADAAALAAVIDLPDEAAAVGAALAYAADNMNPGVHGEVLKQEDVAVGTWDFASESFTPGGVEPNAVRVVTRRSAANGNPVAMNFLRVLSLFGLRTEWDVTTAAIATRFVPGCINDGLIALENVDTQSNNHYYEHICLHGQNQGVALRQDNIFEPGVQVSMGDLDELFVPDMSGNTGLAEALAEGDVWPRDIGALDAILETLRSLDSSYSPLYDYMYRTDQNGALVHPERVTGNALPPAPAPYTVYDIDCNGQLGLPANTTLSNVVIIASCRIHSAANLQLRDVALFSTASGASAAIDMAAGTVLGAADDCAAGGGVELYAHGDMQIAAQGAWHGLRIVSGADVAFTARNVGIHGLSVQAVNIDFTSGNRFGLCTGNVPGPFVWHYRLVR